MVQPPRVLFLSGEATVFVLACCHDWICFYKTACRAVLFPCGARVSVAYVRDMLAFPVAAETTMIWSLVVMLPARLNPCPEQAEYQLR